MNNTINQEKLNASIRFLNKKGEACLEQMRLENPEAANYMEKMGNLFKNEEFCLKFYDCKDLQSAVALFVENGVEMTEEGVKALIDYVKAIIKKLRENDGELTEEDLEQVAGGGWGGAFLGGLLGFVVGAIVGGIAATIYCGPGFGTLVGIGIGAGVGLVAGGIAGYFILDE